MSEIDSTPENPTKKCSRCGQEFPATTEYFAPRKRRGQTGLAYECRECKNKEQAKYRNSHREILKEKARIYRSTPEYKERQKQYNARPDVKAKRNEYFRRWTKTPEGRKKRREEKAKYRQTHKKEIALQNASHREQRRAYDVRRGQTPERKAYYKKADHKRRTQKLQAGGSFTTSELQAVIAAHTNPKTGELICAWCGKPIKGQYHLDHWIPLSKGGTNEAGNLRIMHPKCNLKKNAKLPSELGRLL